MNKTCTPSVGPGASIARRHKRSQTSEGTKNIAPQKYNRVFKQEEFKQGYLR